MAPAGDSTRFLPGARPWAPRLCLFALFATLSAVSADPSAPRKDGSADSRILYHEESGGLVTSVAPPRGPGSKPRERMGSDPKPMGSDPKLPRMGSDPKSVPASRKKAKPAPEARDKPREARIPPEPVSRVGSDPIREPGLGSDPIHSERLEYAALLQRHAARRGTALERARALAEEGGAKIVAFRDADAAVALGWLWLEGRQADHAQEWFTRSRAWAPDKRDAVRGIAFAALAQSDFQRALEASADLPPSPERSTIRRDALVGSATALYRDQRPREAADQFEAAAREGDLPRYARALYAWSVLGVGRKDDSGRMFAVLYREAPDGETAHGLLASGATLDANLATSEPLAGLLRQRGADAAFNARRFLEAAALRPDLYAPYGAVQTPYLAGALGWRDKTGEEGQGRLHVRNTATIEAHVPLKLATSLRIRSERAELDAGADTRAKVEVHQVALRWEQGVAIEASVGRAPFGGVLPSKTTASLDIGATPAWGQASLALATAPVRESILSFAGMRDPTTGQAFGRVFRDSVEARALWLERAPWSIAGRVAAARYKGVNVEDNNYRGAEIAFGRDLGIENMSYAAVSVALSDEKFDKNLSGFTPGDGGYFSPQRYRRAGLALDFMTAEKCVWILRGRAAAGRVNKREDDVKSWGNDFSMQLAGAFSLSPYVHVGWALARGLSPQYRESQGLLQVKLLLEPRLYVASADIPGFAR